MNLTYVSKNDAFPSIAAAEEYLAREFSQLTERIGKLHISIGGTGAQMGPSPRENESDLDRGNNT